MGNTQEASNSQKVSTRQQRIAELMVKLSPEEPYALIVLVRVCGVPGRQRPGLPGHAFQAVAKFLPGPIPAADLLTSCFAGTK
jgi:hypothetical protein